MKVDMSPHAITVRLRRASQLRRLCLSLSKARPPEAPAHPAFELDSSLRDGANRQR